MRKKLTVLMALSVLVGAAMPTVHAEDRAVPSLQDAMTLAREKKYDEAVTAIREIMQQRPETENREAHMSLGVVYFKAKRYDEALSEFARTVELRKNSPMAYYFMGLINEKKAVGETDKTAARELKQKALEAWNRYLGCADESQKLSPAHCKIGISVGESIRRARKHVATLEEELRNG